MAATKTLESKKEVQFPDFFTVKESQNMPEVIYYAWKEVQKWALKHPGMKLSDQQLWLVGVKNHFDTHFIHLMGEKATESSNGSKLTRDKFLSTTYINARGQLCLILGYKVKQPDTYHLMIKINQTEDESI
jgi:uncharacterized protein YbcV (DUF1398 family)